MIERKYYFLGVALILLIPIVFRLNLLIWGLETQGTVLHYVESHSRAGGTYPVIRYEVGNYWYNIVGPQNVKYEIGSKVTIFYQKENPSNSLVFDYLYLYLRQSVPTILTTMLLIFWSGFYLAWRKNPKSKYNDLPKLDFKYSGR